jgi:hypothetical protein
MCRQLMGLHLVPTRVRLTHHRESACSEFSEFLGGEVKFDAAVDEVVFTSTIKHMPVVSADPYLNKLLISICEESCSPQRANRCSFRSTVESAIAPLLPHGKVRAGKLHAGSE